IEVIAAIIGTLKAGAVFCPLDPTFPLKRLQVMVEGVQPQFFIGDSRLVEKLVEITSGIITTEKVIVLDDGPVPSGSSFENVFVPLCAGGVVCAPESRKLVLEPARLIDWVDVEGVEVLQCVPSVLRSLLNEGLDAKYFSSLRWVVLAGEALLPADVKRWVEVFGERIRLVNLYGPTETTVTKLCYFVEAVDAERPSVPIGKPIPGAEVLVVNSKGKLSRPGVA